MSMSSFCGEIKNPLSATVSDGGGLVFFLFHFVTNLMLSHVHDGVKGRQELILNR